MTAEEIRAELRETIRQFNHTRPSSDTFWILSYGMLGEIAAQLAELNERERTLDFFRVPKQ
jgi:hypothetical protein